MRYFLIILFCWFNFSLIAQPWQWVKGGSCTGDTARGSSVCVDEQGNVYAAGTFSQKMMLDTILLTSKGNADIFVVKYDNSGNLVWAKTAGGIADDGANAVGTDGQGNIYISGYFMDTAQFDTVQLISEGNDDIFIAKYSPLGNVLWAKRAGGIYEDRISFENGGMKIDKMGHIYVTGQFESGPTNGAADFGSITLISPGESGIFLAKYDTNGNVLWAKSAGGRHFNFAYDITTDAVGNIFLTGEYEPPSAYFDSIKITTASGGYGSGDMFIAKYDSNGKAQWANTVGGSRLTQGFSNVPDEMGNIYVTGSMSSEVTIFSRNVSLPGSTDIFNGFIAKYTSSGSLLWAKNIGVNTLDYNNGNYMAKDETGSLYITGQFEGYSYLFDTTLSYGSDDVFIAKYDSSGNGIWFAQGGGQGVDEGYGVAVDNIGSIYTTGNFEGATGTFGSIVVAGGRANAFLGKLSATTGIWEPFKRSNNISVYPDPADGSVTLDMGAGSFTKLQVRDGMGRTVYQQAVGGKGKVVVNTSGFVDGLYFVSVAGSDGVMVSKKVVVEH